MRQLGFFVACLAVQAGYALLLRQGFRRVEKTPAPPPTHTPVSVVVAAKDEQARLHELAAALDAQTHTDFEIVVVDDHSTDATPRLLADWAARNDRVQVVQNTDRPGKKHALAAGIAAARHDALALTDADCAPPPGWLRSLAAWHDEHGETLLVFYCPYRPRPGLLNRFARYETFVTGFLTAAAIGLGRPYMAVGRGMSYSQPLFSRLGGFAGHDHLLSGDDDLLVQAAARLPDVRVVHPIGPETFVPSEAPVSWRAWLRQKRRHLSDGPHYDRRVQLHLALFHASSLALWLAPIAGTAGMALLAGRLGFWAWAMAPAAQRFGERDLLRRLPVLEGLYALYNAVLAPTSLLAGRLRRW